MTEVVFDRFKQLAVLAGLKRLLITSSYFDITLLRTLLEATARTECLTAERAELLRALHCIPWSEMGPELALETRKEVCYLFGVDISAINPSTGAAVITDVNINEARAVPPGLMAAVRRLFLV